MSTRNEKDELKNSGEETLKTETPNDGGPEHEADESLTEEVVEETTTDVVSDPDEKPDENEEATVILPEAVTPEPRSEEELHLDLIKHSQPLIQAYLAVSDDQGEFLGNQELEKRVKDFCELRKNVGKENVDDPNEILEEAKQLAREYAPQINITGSIAAGVLTKYLIRLGMLFNIQKDLVKKVGLNWVEHYRENYKAAMSLRSVQDYMALARVPNTIRYAFLGKERLREILRAVKNSKDPDPIGKYLADHGIVFDPKTQEEDLTEQIRVQIDTLIAMIRISSAKERNEVEFDVDSDLIKNLIEMGRKVEGGIIGTMIIIAQSGGDVNQYLDRRYLNRGAEHPIVLATQKVRAIPGLVASLKNTVNYIRENADLAKQINSSQVESLERYVAELRTLVTSA